MYADLWHYLCLLLFAMRPLWAGTVSVLAPYVRVWHGVTPQPALGEWRSKWGMMSAGWLVGCDQKFGTWS